MPTLIFRLSDGSEQQARLDSELTVGREPGNDVVLKEAGVSRRHCRIFVGDDGQVWVEDLGSANGVVIDGERIAEPAPVSEGTELLIGPVSATLQAARRPAAPRRPAAGAGGSAPRPSRPGPAASRPEPVALAQRPSSAPAPRPNRATRMMAASEMPQRSAKPAPAPRKGGAADTRARLKGVTGPWAGQAFELDKPRVLIGRVPPADVQLEDDSVSRRHAEIYKTGSTLSVRDLGSANGTFLNGERISEAPLSPGDTVRFGVVELAYAGPGGARAAAPNPKKKKMLILAGAGGGLVLLLLIAALSAQPAAQGPGAGGGALQPDMPPEQEDPVRVLGRCKAYSDCENEQVNWEKAVEVCAHVIELDPALTEARSLERLARKELGFQKLLADAKLKVATAQDDAAIKMLTQVDSNSCFFSRARSEFKDAVERISKRAKTDCKTEFKAGYYQAAYEACRRFKEVTCNRVDGSDPDVERLFDLSSQKAGKGNEFTCPPEYRQFQGGTMLAVIASAANAEDAIRKKYPDQVISAVMVRYFNTGRPKQLSDELKRVRAKQGRKYGDSLDNLIAQLDLIDGRYTSGQEGLLRHNPDETESYWKGAFDSDKALMPDGVRSYMARDMGAQLASAFYKQGMDALQKDRLRDGFKAFFRGWEYDKANNDILVQLAGMERAASEALREPSCENVAYALDITIPDGDVNKKAKAMKAELNCQ